MATVSLARRVPAMDDLEHAGDYTGPHPVQYPDGERQQVLFLLPVHRGEDKSGRPAEGSGIHGVTSPPWDFRECPDGSLEIRASIGCGVQPYYWHGYLDEGNAWRQV
jgi:hypothetical protein